VEIVVASGKGGTGKTFISSNFSIFLKEKAKGVIAVDADVEAPDLLIALGGALRTLWKKDIFESEKAEINQEKCTLCENCISICTFHALKKNNGKITVVPEFCEGCKACYYVCPEKAISFYMKKTGILYVAVSKTGIPVVTGDLSLGERNMGHIVYEIKNVAKSLALKENINYRVIDAAPGIGCTVISSIAGADYLIVVVEPMTPSLKGARRLIELSKHFNVKAYAIVNKYDLNVSVSERINKLLGVPILGKIRYDNLVVESYSQMLPLIKYFPKADIVKEMINSFENIWEVVTSE